MGAQATRSRRAGPWLRRLATTGRFRWAFHGRLGAGEREPASGESGNAGKRESAVAKREPHGRKQPWRRPIRPSQSDPSQPSWHRSLGLLRVRPIRASQTSDPSHPLACRPSFPRIRVSLYPLACRVAVSGLASLSPAPPRLSPHRLSHHTPARRGSTAPPPRAARCVRGGRVRGPESPLPPLHQVPPLSPCPSRLCPSRLCPSRLCPSRLCPSRLCPSRLCPSRLCRRRPRPAATPAGPGLSSATLGAAGRRRRAPSRHATSPPSRRHVPRRTGVCVCTRRLAPS